MIVGSKTMHFLGEHYFVIAHPENSNFSLFDRTIPRLETEKLNDVVFHSVTKALKEKETMHSVMAKFTKQQYVELFIRLQSSDSL